jgi:YHS domain-containing protein
MLAVAVPAATRVTAATTERVVNDYHTGLAIDGVDPVGYFTDATPLFGRADFEYRYAGVVWRFRNEGNKAAFVENPDVYMPRYGGYDAVALGRSVALPGNPMIWAIVGQHLYLFYSDEARAQFVAKPDEAIVLADSKWPAVVGSLVQ